MDGGSGGESAGGGGAGDGAGGGSELGDAEAASGSWSALRCDELRGALPERTGTTHVVSPAADGQVRVNGQLSTLRQVVADAQPGDTVALEDGVYTFPQAAGDYTGVYITTPDITLRSVSGDAAAVVLDSAYGDRGGESAPVTVAARGVAIADLTVQRSVYHLIHFWEAGDAAIVHNVRLVDGGQQFVKASAASGSIDDVQVSCCEFVMTAAGRANVWGYGPEDGLTKCYTGGIDTHESRRWRVLSNRFEGIYCDETGVARPAHGVGQAPTYRGGLAEHAIHMWDSPAGAGHAIEGNWILDCARGIGIGMRDEVYDTTVRNNVVWSSHPASSEHDAAINVDRGHDIDVDHNTVFYRHADGYANSIELRWGSTSNLRVRNNLANRPIRERDGATASLSRNVTDARPEAFVDPERGDLHLAACAIEGIAGQGEALSSVPRDVDGEERGTRPDVGADQCSP